MVGTPHLTRRRTKSSDDQYEADVLLDSPTFGGPQPAWLNAPANAAAPAPSSDGPDGPDGPDGVRRLVERFDIEPFSDFSAK